MFSYRHGRLGPRHRRTCLGSPMSSRSTNNEVLVIIGVGGMGVSVARRSGAGRTIVLADINADGLNAAAGGLIEDGHQVLTREVDVTSRSLVGGGGGGG